MTARTLNLVIPVPELSELSNGWCRLSAAVDGDELWFESDHTLISSSEAFATAMMLPAMKSRQNIVLMGPANAAWKANVDNAQRLVSDWWEYSKVKIDCTESREVPAAGRQTAMFFTGGVDSFYSLHESPDVRALIYVEGFDVKLGNVALTDKIVHELEVIAAAKGRRFIRIRTNLRTHVRFREINWEESHGAALAAVGHTLANNFSRILIAGTDVPGPHGSHPDLDETWSSDAVHFEYHAAGVRRIDKAAAIVADSLVARYLHVCWQDMSVSTVNCSQCEKCIRTHCQLLAADPTFGARQKCFVPGNVGARLAVLPSVPNRLLGQWADIFAHLDIPGIDQARSDFEQKRGSFQVKSERGSFQVKSAGWRKKLRRFLRTIRRK